MLKGKIVGWRDDLLLLIREHGMRTSHRNSHFWFDEKNSTLLLDIITDTQSGLSVGDRVVVNTSLLTPWHLGDRAVEPRGKFCSYHNTSFRILAFVRVAGKFRNICRVEGTYCILVTEGFCGFGVEGYEDDPICRGQELGEEPSKVNLYWVGCLDKPDWLKQDEDA